MRDIDVEDVALLIAIIASAFATVVDEISGSTVFKVIKIVAPILSLIFAIQKIRTSKPFYRDVNAREWVKSGNEFEIIIPEKEHGRGKNPSAKCLVENEGGAFVECNALPEVLPNGSVIVKEHQPIAFRLEVRK